MPFRHSHRSGDARDVQQGSTAATRDARLVERTEDVIAQVQRVLAVDGMSDAEPFIAAAGRHGGSDVEQG